MPKTNRSVTVSPGAQTLKADLPQKVVTPATIKPLTTPSDLYGAKTKTPAAPGTEVLSHQPAMPTGKSGAAADWFGGASSAVSTLVEQFHAHANADQTIDGADLEACFAKAGHVDQPAVLESLYRAIERGTQFTGRARAMASEKVGGFHVAGITAPISTGVGVNAPLVELEHTLHEWAHQGVLPTAAQLQSLKSACQAAVVGAETPVLVKSFLAGELKDALAALSSKPEGKAAAAQLKGVMTELALDQKLPTHQAASRAQILDGFTAVEAELAWHSKKMLAPDPLCSDFVGMMNDLLADGQVSPKDADYLTSYFQKFVPTGFLAMISPGSKLFKRQELEGFSNALAALPPQYIDADTRSKLNGWISEQLKRAPEKKVFADQSVLRLPGAASTNAATSLNEIAKDPKLVDEYIRQVRSGDRESHELFFYGQQGLQYEDPLADYALATESVHTFFRLGSALVGGNKTRKANDELHEKLKATMTGFLQNPLDAAEKAKNPIVAPMKFSDPIPGSESSKARPLNVAGFQKMLTQVIFEERKNGIEPKAGKVHTWSKQFTDKYKSNFAPFTLAPKLLIALAKGTTWQHMATGKELGLIDYMKTCPPHSIQFEQLFRAAYKLNDGDVYLSLMTIENVLAKNWRMPGRENLDVIQRLDDIANYGPTGDKYGCWYHLAGMMLYGYTDGALKAQTVGNVETAGSHVLSHFEAEWQENWVNHLGGKIGGNLRELIDTRAYLAAKDDPAALKVESYLSLVDAKGAPLRS